jgi:hypothetical protein
MRRTFTFGPAVAAGLMLSVPAMGADLEVGAGGRVRVPAQQFPHQWAMYGKLLAFANSDEVAKNFREKIAAHARRPVLVLVQSDARAAHPTQDFRAIWAGNILMSPDDNVVRLLGQVEVVLAPLSLVRTAMPDADAGAAAYLVGLRDGKPFAWTLPATNPTEQALVSTFGPRVGLTKEAAAARAKAVREALDEKTRTAIEAAFKDLGHDAFEKREAASRFLAERLKDIAPWVQAELEAADDVEVKARCSALLAEAGKVWRDHPPTGSTWSDANGNVLLRAKLERAVAVPVGK